MSRKLKIASHVCRTLVGLIFVFSGFVKAVDPWGTALKVNEYLSIYGMEQLSGVSMVFSIWLCGAELMMGLMLLFKGDLAVGVLIPVGVIVALLATHIMFKKGWIK